MVCTYTRKKNTICISAMLMEAWCCKVLFPSYLRTNRLKTLSYRRNGEYGKDACFSKFRFYFVTQLHAAHLVLSRWTLSKHRSKTAHATIDLRSRHRIIPRPSRFVSGNANECRWRPQRCQVDPWSRGQAVARDVPRSSPQTWKKVYFLPLERDR